MVVTPGMVVPWPRRVRLEGAPDGQFEEVVASRAYWWRVGDGTYYQSWWSLVRCEYVNRVLRPWYEVVYRVGRWEIVVAGEPFERCLTRWGARRLAGQYNRFPAAARATVRHR